ncbi:MAG: gamma-glutamyl-gamma-aminobutyrate hydrolase family protein [Pelagibacterales bacterium]|nr:gamma-glutamyl-gamma-aminobutyrate hydrolase family protein [Pelagibacterales bacterium]
MFKKRVGITQRVMKHSSNKEVMDCLDINWAKLLVPLEILPIPLPLVPISSVNDIWKTLKLDGLILSGGNTLADYADTTDKHESISVERDVYEKALLKAALSTHTPVLGVCRGLQVINVYYHGQLEKIKGHAGTRHLLIPENSINGLEIPSEVNSFHDCAVPRKHLGKSLISLAHDAEDNIEAFYHPKDKVLGIMWHPERISIPLDSDCKLIKNHFGI